MGVTVTMTLEPTQVPDGTEDDAPDVDSPGYDSEAPYGYTKSGRIRKRPIGTRTTTGGGPARSERLARQATAVIVQVNGYAVIGAMAAGMANTASKLADQQSTFEDNVYNALVLDPGLCAIILKAGVKSGKLMLLVAILGHIAAVVPTAITEYRERGTEE